MRLISEVADECISYLIDDAIDREGAWANTGSHLWHARCIVCDLEDCQIVAGRTVPGPQEYLRWPSTYRVTLGPAPRLNQANAWLEPRDDGLTTFNLYAGCAVRPKVDHHQRVESCLCRAPHSINAPEGACCASTPLPGLWEYASRPNEFVHDAGYPFQRNNFDIARSEELQVWLRRTGPSRSQPNRKAFNPLQSAWSKCHLRNRLQRCPVPGVSPVRIRLIQRLRYIPEPVPLTWITITSSHLRQRTAAQENPWDWLWELVSQTKTICLPGRRRQPIRRTDLSAV